MQKANMNSPVFMNNPMNICPAPRPPCSAQEVEAKYLVRANTFEARPEMEWDLIQLTQYDIFFKSRSPGREAAKATLEKLLISNWRIWGVSGGVTQ